MEIPRMNAMSVSLYVLSGLQVEEKQTDISRNAVKLTCSPDSLDLDHAANIIPQKDH
jgi:hypothetical protein